jgi:hypothetical protein
MSVTAAGVPAQVACGTSVAAPLCPLLTRAVSRWQFTPGQRDGVPVEMDIWLNLGLVAVQKPGGFGIQATHALVSPRRANAPQAGVDPESRALNPPSYPRDELRRRIGAFVVVEIGREPGSSHPRVLQAWRDRISAKPDDPFVQASRAAIETWDLVPWPEEQQAACVTIEFTLSNPKSDPTRATPDHAPCKASYAPGFVAPKLLTDATTASF